ncbi:hypothetical protein [Streptomyces sp. A1547]|uniref:hypothetical protein n=1 Tax=Streptomyces sp. A1547 TaxID=2563105 RepID=UPI00144A5319|nr:hypothetical protein [Streptomyces sp. A1547]
MGKWWKFGLGRDKGEGEGQAPEPTPEPTPAPSPPPAAEAPAPAEKKPGFFGRLLGRGKKKPPPAEAPPAAPAAPPAAPPPPTPPAPPAEGPAEGPEEGPEEGEEGEEEEEEREFPDSVDASVDGTWVISDSVWHGVISGTLTGEDAKAFILAIEKGKEHIAIGLLARAYDDQDMGFARYLDIKSSSWGSISY